MRRTTPRFTLIELLVVVAIIAILAGMLLPALNQAREKGKAITCVSDQKQIMLYLSLYLDDHRNHYQYRCGDVSGDPGWPYVLFRGKYADCSYDLVMCPSLPYDGTGSFSLSVVRNKIGFKVCYGMIGMFSPLPYQLWTDSGKFRYLALTHLKSPSGTPLAGDSYQGGSPYWGVNGAQVDVAFLGRSNPGHGNVHARHGGRINLMFLDSHVEAAAPGRYARALRDGDAKYTGTVRYYPQRPSPTQVPVAVN